MRNTVAGFVCLASLLGLGSAVAAECPAGALGVSRTIVVDPSEHTLLGGMQYSESLPLKDREVVLTFDDGPLPPYTNRILETLASECVKATFFMVGRMVRGYPSIVQRIYNEGHTIANHSQNHPFTFHKMTVDQASHEIEDGFASLRSVLGNPKAVSPFFRIPGLLRQSSVEQYLAAHGYMTWSVDFAADDWTRISAQEVAKRALNRIEAHGRGILLLHDIQPATALAFPEILREIKARGYKIVHVVPATPDRPKTVTLPEQWMVRRTAEQKIWPRTLVMGEGPAPVLTAPTPASFGIEDLGPGGIKVALADTFERKPVNDADTGRTAWPQPAVHALPAHVEQLPVPASYNFRYPRPFRSAAKPKPLAHKKPAGTVVATVSPTSLAAPAAAAKPKDKPKEASGVGGILSLLPGAQRGHQLTVARPPSSVAQPSQPR
ncbi:MAG: polysaccharide deacetylase family protein [Hyphomicrobiales bacterium]|nr:polysaccharide deacetylase family protein [Hyphomicrobiales bacterium]